MRHNGYTYTTAHFHNVDCREKVQDGRTLVDIGAGFEVAPGDANDVEVANAHPWGSDALVFSEGWYAATALAIAVNPGIKGTLCYFL